MSRLCIHLISPKGVDSRVMRRGTAISSAFFPPDDTGKAAMGDWLRKHRADIHCVVADLPDERLERIPLPRLGHRDRKSIIARKLVQHFPGSEFVTALPEVRSGQSHAVLTGFPQEALSQWISLMQQEALLISGILTPTLLCRDLLRHANPRPQDGLLVLVSPDRHRHLYFAAGQVCFTRQIHAADEHPGIPPENAHREIRQTIQYLGTNRLLDRSAALPIFLLGDTLVAEALRSHIQADPFQPDQQASILSLPQKSEEGVKSTTTQDILIQAAVGRKRGPQLARPALRAPYQLNITARVLSTLSMTAAAIMLVAAVDLSRQTETTQHKTTMLTAANARKTEALHALEARLPASIHDPASLHKLRKLTNIIRTQEHLPGSILSLLAQSLDHHPEVEAESLEWAVDMPSFKEPPQAPTLHLNAHIMSRTAGSSAAAQNQVLAFSSDLQRLGFEISRPVFDSTPPQIPSSPPVQIETLPFSLKMTAPDRQRS